MPLTRKPRIAIMGEFSSGKSTLCNVLMGANRCWKR
jgi:GTPase Era involved in 16S rRNA processing